MGRAQNVHYVRTAIRVLLNPGISVRVYRGQYVGDKRVQASAIGVPAAPMRTVGDRAHGSGRSASTAGGNRRVAWRGEPVRRR